MATVTTHSFPVHFPLISSLILQILLFLLVSLSYVLYILLIYHVYQTLSPHHDASLTKAGSCPLFIDDSFKPKAVLGAVQVLNKKIDECIYNSYTLTSAKPLSAFPDLLRKLDKLILFCNILGTQCMFNITLK